MTDVLLRCAVHCAAGTFAMVKLICREFLVALKLFIIFLASAVQSGRAQDETNDRTSHFNRPGHAGRESIQERRTGGGGVAFSTVPYSTSTHRTRIIL